MNGVGGAHWDLRLRWSRWLIAAAAASMLLLLAWAWTVPPTWLDASHADDLGAFGAFALALLLLSVALVVFAALFVRASGERHRLAAELRESRDALRRVDELLDVWQWQTDAAHRLVAMRAPNGPDGGANWAPSNATAPLLWDHLSTDDPAELRASLERGAPLADLIVQRRDAAPPIGRRARLRGRALSDAQGAFAGYHGTLREIETPARTAAPSNAAARPSEQPTDADSFSYTISHDLRAPLRVVEGFTKIVKEDYGSVLDHVGNEHLDRVLGAAARMNNMIDALLALSKLSSQPLTRQSVNLSLLADYVAEDLRHQSPDRRAEFVIQPGMQVEGDPTLLRVLMENLIGNAWKYTGKRETAQIRFERGAGADAFVLRDNGAGFDMRFADRLFGVFQRLHSANEFAGTGVGLASARRIVRRHGGDIWGEAEPDRGARFHFTLPRDPQA
ncbi:MAG TPA: ATP-binding protein [Burkholderiaceae bacterium]